jgi:hypothetical protein
MRANHPRISLVVEHFKCWGEAFLLKSNVFLLHPESPLTPCQAPYVSDVIEMGMEIHTVEADGAVHA